MWCVVVWRVSSACFVVCGGHTVWCVACGVWGVARGCVAWNFVALLSCVCVRQSTLWHCLSSPSFVRPSTLSRLDCSFCSETKKGLLAVCPLPAPLFLALFHPPFHTLSRALSSVLPSTPAFLFHHRLFVVYFFPGFGRSAHPLKSDDFLEPTRGRSLFVFRTGTFSVSNTDMSPLDHRRSLSPSLSDRWTFSI